MKRPIEILLATLLTALAIPTHAAETDRVVEAFLCSYNDGQGPEELRSAIDFWKAQVDRIGDADLSGYGAGLLTPLRATMDGDFIWVGGNGHLNAMARGLTAAQRDPGGSQATERFFEVADCDANLYFSNPVFVGTSPAENTATEAVIELHACTLREGKTPAHAQAAETHFSSVAEATDAAVNVFRWRPFLANTPYDLVYLGVHSDLNAFASFNTQMLTSEGGKENGRRFAETMDCESGLFNGEQIRRAPNPG